MIGENDMRENELIIKRFCGEEIYPLINSKWYLIRDTLWIDLAFGKGTLLHEDTEYLEEEPTWELSFKIDGEDELKPMFTILKVKAILQRLWNTMD